MMDTPFIYDSFVTGKYFIGRKTECNSLRNLLEQKENICIYEPPKTGKMSVIQQTMFNMRLAGMQFAAPLVDLFNVRDIRQFLLKFGSAIIRSTASTPAEYGEIVRTMLSDTHFTFDQERFSAHDEILTADCRPDTNDIRKMLALPREMSARQGLSIFIIISEFQNLLSLGETGYETVFKIMMEDFTGDDKSGNPHVSYILSGSKVNAMKFIFEERKYFYRQVEHLPLNGIDSREISDHITRGFLTGGKVIEQDLMAGTVELFKGNLWYITHFASICNSLSKGFMNEGILMDALRIILSIHTTRFKAITDDLSVHQISLLRAITDGEVRFSSVEVIEKYDLHSSANVRRVKEALQKKEIITFDDNGEPSFLDPLFEYWIRKYYFEKE